MSIRSRLHHRSTTSPIATTPDARRAFFRRISGLSIGALGVGLLAADQTWATVEERANRFGIIPGTTVDAKGLPVAGNPADPLLGEIMLVPYNFAPTGWSFCQGQLLAISSSTALFSLLGTTYGGDGRTTFGLPDLRGRSAMSSGSGPGLTSRTLGTRSGAEQVVLTNPNQIPSHTHTSPFSDGSIAIGGTFERLTPAGGNTTVADTTGPTGGGQGHDNMPPFLVLNYCIALQGVFPTRN